MRNGDDKTRGRYESQVDMEFDFGDEEVELFEKPKWYREFGVHIGLSILILLIIFIRTCLFNVYIVSGESMLPTMNHFEIALVSKIEKPSNFQRGDIIIFKGEERYVKRIIGLGGDTISIKDNKVFINGVELQEPYLDADMHYVMTDLDEVIVPENSFFVLGDNRGNSIDSRNGLGLPTYDDIIGKVIFHVESPIKINKN